MMEIQGGLLLYPEVMRVLCDPELKPERRYNLLSAIWNFWAYGTEPELSGDDRYLFEMWKEKTREHMKSLTMKNVGRILRELTGSKSDKFPKTYKMQWAAKHWPEAFDLMNGVISCGILSASRPEPNITELNITELNNNQTEQNRTEQNRAYTHAHARTDAHAREGRDRSPYSVPQPPCVTILCDSKEDETVSWSEYQEMLSKKATQEENDEPEEPF